MPHPGARSLALAVSAALTVAAAAPAQSPVDDVARFFETVEVRLLEVDVVVVDRDGDPVGDLTTADFEVAADGDPLEILGFEAHAEVLGAPPADAATVPADAASIAGPEPAPGALTWIVHVDDSRLRAARRNAILKQLGEFLEADLRPADRAMVTRWDGESLRVVSRLSTDRQGALDALREIAASAVRSSALDGTATNLRTEINNVAPLSINIAPDKEERRRRDDPPTDELRPGTRVAAESLLRQIEALGDLEIARTRAALAGLTDLMALAAGVEGRVGLVLVGAGYESDRVDDLYRLWESRFASLDLDARAGVLGARDHEVARDYERALASFANGGVTVFTVGAVEAEGLDVVETSGAGAASRGASAATGGSGEAAMSLAGLADATGGRTFAAGGELAGRLSAARRHLATYYTLGVRPRDGAAPPAIEVRVRRAGARALYRSRVDERPPEALAAADAISALLESGTVTSPGLRIETGSAAPAPGVDARIVAVTVGVPVAELTLAPDGRSHRGALGYHFAIERPDGAFVRLEPRSLDFEIANAELEGSLAGTVSFRIDIALGAGEHWLGVAVLDRNGGRRWSGAVPVDVAATR